MQRRMSPVRGVCRAAVSPDELSLPRPPSRQMTRLNERRDKPAKIMRMSGGLYFVRTWTKVWKIWLRRSPILSRKFSARFFVFEPCRETKVRSPVTMRFSLILSAPGCAERQSRLIGTLMELCGANRAHLSATNSTVAIGA